jgi:hypothetical protein
MHAISTPEKMMKNVFSVLVTKTGKIYGAGKKPIVVVVMKLRITIGFYGVAAAADIFPRNMARLPNGPETHAFDSMQRVWSYLPNKSRLCYAPENVRICVF